MPSDPGFLTGNPTLSKVALTWGSVGGVLGYRVYRRRTSVTMDYILIKTTTALAYDDYVPSYDTDTAGAVPAEEWQYMVASYDSGGESPGARNVTVTMTALTGTDIKNSTISHTPYNDGADQTASYTITNATILSATVDTAAKSLHENRNYGIGRYAGGAAQ